MVVPINPAYTVPELDHILADSGARLLITGSVSAIAAAADLRARHRELTDIVVAGRSGNDELPTLHELVAEPAIRRTGPDGPDSAASGWRCCSTPRGRPAGPRARCCRSGRCWPTWPSWPSCSRRR